MGIRIDPGRRRGQNIGMTGRVRARCFLVFCWSVASCVAAEKTRFALVIGNAKYEAAVGPLRNSVNDAKAVSKALRNLGFAVTEEHNVSRADMMEAVTDFRAKIKDAEVAVFYYAGHGISVGGSNYLIPLKSTYQPAGADEMALRMLAETKLFNAEQIVAEMSASGARCNLVILDACRNTPVADAGNARSLTSSGGLTEMKPPAGSLIAFATDAGRTAQDGEGANGLYTGELVKHLQTPGITIEQVFKRTRAAVMKQSGGKQVPAEYSRLVGDDIFLAGAEPAKPVTPKAERVEVLDFPAIRKLAAAGKIDECAEALRLITAEKGVSAEAAGPIDDLLEITKERLRNVTGPSAALDFGVKACTVSLELIESCLPPSHPRRPELTGKARNRLGDCQMLLGKPDKALESYHAAVSLLPDDAYPLYNRGRAYQALDRKDEAKADFEAAAGPKFKQPAARKLALEALKGL